MKLAILCGLVTVAVLAGIPASAQEPLVLYDNFEAKVLNADKWFGKESSDQGVSTLESGRQIKTEPLFVFKGLDILNRSYASEESGTGSSTAHTRLLFADGSNVTSIQATVLVKKIQATGCSTNPFATSPRLRIGGMFFNIGTPTPGDSTNDVWAFIAVGRAIDSTNPPNVLDVYGRAFLCGDTNCTGANSTLIGEQALGTVKVNQKTKLRITWDPDNDRFTFQKGKDAEVHVTYTEDDANPPGAPNGGNKRLEVQHQIANCIGAPRPLSYMEAFFDNIMVNASAVP
jgi:hypothetical protein